MKEDILNQDLEEMRAQLALLNKKLENETIINEKLMRGVMKDKVRKINRDIWVAVAGCVLGMASMLLLSFLCHFSLVFFIVTQLYFVLAAVYSYYARRGINRIAVLEGNLVELGVKVAKMRHLNALWLRFGIPFSVIWFVWFLYEFSVSGNEDTEMLIESGIIGGVIGAIVGYIKYKHTQKNAREIIDSIKELTKEEEL